MPQNVALAAFIFGAVLALIALLGGGFKLFGAEIAGTIGNRGRVFAGIAGVILIVIGLLHPFEKPQSQTPSTPTSKPGIIPFGALDNPDVLNPVLSFQKGSSTANSYDLKLYPGALTIIAGPRTFPGIPMIIYPYKGDFVAQVKIVVSPERKYQGAGLVVKPAQARFDSPTTFPNDWVSASKYLADQQYVQCSKDNELYADDTVYVRIERRGVLFSCAYSTNGNNWVILQKDRVLKLPDDVDIFLYAYSAENDKGIVAQFYEFSVYNK